MIYLVVSLAVIALFFAVMFFVERSKVKQKNSDIDELHKIIDEMKFDLHKVRNDYIRVSEEKKTTVTGGILTGGIEAELALRKNKKEMEKMRNAAMQSQFGAGGAGGYGLGQLIGFGR